MDNESIMQYLLIGLLLIYGYIFLFGSIKRSAKPSVLPVVAIILFLVYAAISGTIIVFFSRYGDLRRTLLMLLITMSVVGFFMMLYGFLNNWHEINKIPALLFVLYLAALSYVTIFSRSKDMPTGILLEFESVIKAIQEHSFEPIEDLRMNILMFIPIGFLFVAIYPEKLNRINLVFSLGLMLTVIIETVQMVLKLGVCDLQDLVANAIGALLGLFLYRGYHMLQPKYSKAEP